MAVLTSTDKKTTSRRTRLLRENLVAYGLLSPAMILIFIFGIFPVGFAFFVSLYRWRRFPDDYLGMDHYLRALGDFAYILFFWLAIGALVYATSLLLQLWRTGAQRGKALAYLVPGGVTAAALLTFVNWMGILLPIIINIPQQIRGQERVPGIFIQALFASFQVPEAAVMGNTFLALLIGCLVLSNLWQRVIGGEKWDSYLLWGTAVIFVGGCGALVLSLTLDTIGIGIETARAAGDSLPIWSQIILISAGVGMLGAAYVVWTRAGRQTVSDRRFVFQIGAAILLMVGGYLLITQLPTALTNADRNVMSGFGITVLFVLGTVPFQLGIGLLLAYLLFQKIRAKSLFRVVYFIPYVMPFVATSMVFNIIFGHRSLSLMNQVLTTLGLPPQKWLLEPTGILQLIFPAVPDSLAGPSLALIVIMIYTTWTYIGYDTAIFLAGLGNVPNDVYEAARIDGANSWQMFRRITLPLLSPTTFFLSLIAIIGTFQAFTQIWILRSPAAQSSVDTLGVYIFETVQSGDPNMGYGSAMSFVLFGVILLLTIFQNRIAGRQVFYG